MPPLKAHSYIEAERRRFARAKAGKRWSVKELPQFYYHQNFMAMVDHVGQHHGDLLDKPALQFISDFRALPHGAQCAYVRIAGRKGSIFDTRKLSYPEIGELHPKFQCLRDTQFTRGIARQDFANFLHIISKPDLVLLISDHVCETEFKKSWAKPRLIEIALRQLDFDALVLSDYYIVQDRCEVLHFLLYLYFGRIERSLQPATLQELGLMRGAKMSPPDRSAFEDFAQARTAFFYADSLNRLKLDEVVEDRLISSVDDWPNALTPKSERHRDKLLVKLGRYCERNGQTDTALSLYNRSDTAQCNERVVRLRYKDGDTKWVQARLEAMIDNPASDTEADFAEDFYARKFNKKRTSVVTDMLRAAQVVKIDEAFRHEPERAVLRHYRTEGLDAFRSENTPWRALFALIFWDELYPKGSAYALPDSLKFGSFYRRYRDQIEGKLRKLDEQPRSVFMQILKTLTGQFGQPTSLVRWQEGLGERIKPLLLASPPLALSQMLRLMCQDFTATKDGFPDLMLLENGVVKFIEVKSEGDVLRRNQLTRLKQLRAAGFDADILRVEWVIDPQQIYVVVDVETTGGRPGLHRVTEIGAVKMQGGEIIDEWQSLIHPQRSIPGHITRLTGISGSMVASAPPFYDIAESFAAFMDGAIFVAHNVNFDFGFISAEYAMIGQKFSHPKLCTVREMRKHYPGQRSYSLKNLCLAYQIDLTTHHRALCDAQAAAELLRLVNLKRISI